MDKYNLRISRLACVAIIAMSLQVSSCSLNKQISVTTGRYDNIPNRHMQPHIEVEMSRDTVASYRF